MNEVRIPYAPQEQYRPKSKKRYSKEELTPLFQEIFTQGQTLLDPSIASRLKCGKVVKTHASYRTFYLFYVWDKHQTDVIHQRNFCYCFGYNPERIDDMPQDWYVQLWINNLRIYRDREPMRQMLRERIRKVYPGDSTYLTNDRSVEAYYRFSLDKGLKCLVPTALPLYTRLVSAIHPVLIPIVDQYREPLTREERKKTISASAKIYVGPRKRKSPAEILHYTRSIRKSWLPGLLEKSGSACVHCGEPLHLKNLHADHIIPFSKGGITSPENLQSLCSPCNLKKGNRHSTS